MDYITLDGEVEDLYIEKRSKFIAVAKNVADVEEGLNFLKEVKKKYKEATHYPYAIVSVPDKNEQKVSDDGEPQGTSGMPILTAIKNKSLYGVAVVVVRYFGGIKLGASGLTLAYSKSAKAVLEKGTFQKATMSDFYKIKLSYDLYGKFQNKTAEFSSIVDIKYGDDVEIVVATSSPDRLLDTVNEISAGKTSPEKLYTAYHFAKYNM